MFNDSILNGSMRNSVLYLRFLLLSCVLLIVVDARRHPAPINCPLPRICRAGCDTKRQTIHCSDRMLGPYSPELPDNHANLTWAADFSYNSISVLQNLSFYTFTGEVVLFRSVDYSFNYVKTIQPDAFKGQETSLHTLILSDNMITDIPEEAFQPLKNLHKLHLENNAIVTIDFVCNTEMLNLYQLFLTNNSINEISPTCFYDTNLGLRDESQLTIESNRLRHLDACTFQGRRFKRLVYSDNALVCMCNMNWLASSYQKSETECYPPAGGSLILLSDYRDEFCVLKEEADTIDSYQCHDLEMEATRYDSSNDTSVSVTWQVQNFKTLNHYEVKFYSMANSSVDGLGAYKVNNKQRTFHMEHIGVQPHDELVVCVAASPKQSHDQSRIILPLSEDDNKNQFSSGAFLHTRCRTAQLYTEPIVQALRSSNSGATILYCLTLLIGSSFFSMVNL